MTMSETGEKQPMPMSMMGDTVMVEEERPFGGATSFDDIEEFFDMLDSRAEEQRLDASFDAIMRNIMTSDLQPAQKGAAIQQASDEYVKRASRLNAKAGRRLNNEKRNLIQRLFNDMKKFMSWAEYTDEEDDVEDEDEKQMSAPQQAEMRRLMREGMTEADARREMKRRHSEITDDDLNEMMSKALNEKAVTKTDGGVEYRASDYADVPDAELPSTWKLRLSEGRSGNFTVAQVARAITALQPGGFRGNRVELGDRKSTVISRISAAINKTDGDDDQKENLRDRLNAVKALPLVGGFKAFDTPDGPRWISFSSNAFEDLERELFTTDSLKEAVAHADKTGERGPLLLYHVPSAEIGRADFQEVEGRFLVESGTFDDTPIGRKAADYFIDSDDEHQVSIGYAYMPGDEKDGVYDWLRIRERSVCPYGTAANPWTDFKLGGKTVDDAKKTFLTKVLGPDLTESIIERAKTQSSTLESDGVKFKSLDDLSSVLTAEQMKELLPQLADGPLKAKVAQAVEATNPPPDPPAPPAPEPPAPPPDPSPRPVEDPRFDSVVTALANVGEQLQSLSTLDATVKALQEEVKSLKRSDDEKIAEAMSPRRSIVNNNRPTNDASNVITDDAAKALNVDDDDDAENPVSPYVSMLLNTRR